MSCILFADSLAPEPLKRTHSQSFHFKLSGKYLYRRYPLHVFPEFFNQIPVFADSSGKQDLVYLPFQ